MDRTSPTTTRTRILTEAALWVAVIAVVGCSKDVWYAPAPVPPEHARLYDMIRDFRQDYEQAIGRIVSGDTDGGREALDAASHRLGVLAQLCSTTEGCDADLFTNAMGHVFLEKRVAGDPEMDIVAIESSSEDDGLLRDAPPDASVSVAGPKASPLRGIDIESVIPDDGRVKEALNDWLTWNRPALMETWENYGFLREAVAPVYEENGVPEALLFAIMATESRAKVHAYSRSGAAGPLQFMRHTARRYGLRGNGSFDPRLDPVASTRASLRYLGDQYGRLGHDLASALAAYNVGETRLRRLHRRHGGASYWDPRMFFSLPSETRNYVPQIYAAALLFLDPEEYGVEFPERDTATTSLVLADEISIDELAVCLGQSGSWGGWFRTLRNLNPDVHPSRRLDAGSRVTLPTRLVATYADSCVGDSPILARARELHDASHLESSAMVDYTVRPGDTLARIAARHGCRSVRNLATINGIEAPDYVIHVGQRLSVPVCS